MRIFENVLLSFIRKNRVYVSLKLNNVSEDRRRIELVALH